jgi:hypothetical protein
MRTLDRPRPANSSGRLLALILEGLTIPVLAGIVKAIMPPTTDWAIHKIKSKDFKGFQLGDPARRPKKMCLEL